jgi:hypothetical protein
MLTEKWEYCQAHTDYKGGKYSGFNDHGCRRVPGLDFILKEIMDMQAHIT